MRPDKSGRFYYMILIYYLDLFANDWYFARPFSHS